jgi:Uma2 family endonuclease
MSDPAPARMTSDEFIAWAMEQPVGCHYELVAGEVVAMAPEQSGHALAKTNVWRRLTEAVEASGLPCDVYPDGTAVQIDANTVYGPDVLVRCGGRVPDQTVRLDDPVIVVEVLSPSTQSKDSGAKLIDYFLLPSVHHYLIVRTRDRAIIHHARNPDDTILTRIIREGTLHLDPPGLTVSGLFPPAP